MYNLSLSAEALVEETELSEKLPLLAAAKDKSNKRDNQCLFRCHC